MTMSMAPPDAFSPTTTSRADAPSAAARAGRLACFCPSGIAVARDGEPNERVLLAGGFALAVLSQTLVLGLLPLAGLLLAPNRALATLPYVAMLIGAAVATFPASLLLDAFGRRAAFALGASHGVAGGLMLGFALVKHGFIALCLGAFWLGIAQGFGLFYRHEAAIGASVRSRRMAIVQVFGAGALAGFAAPLVAALADRPFDIPFVGTACAAALAQVLVLTLAMLSSGRTVASDPLRDAQRTDRGIRPLVAPTLIAGAAWFGMTVLMLRTPFAMVGCGIGSGGVMGAIAWHVVAMFVPAPFVVFLARKMGTGTVALAGLALILAASVLARTAATQTGFAGVLVLIAIGWSLATAASTLALHEKGAPRLLLAGHDAVLFGAAVAGALAAVAPLGLV